MCLQHVHCSLLSPHCLENSEEALVLDKTLVECDEKLAQMSSNAKVSLYTMIGHLTMSLVHMCMYLRPFRSSMPIPSKIHSLGHVPTHENLRTRGNVEDRKHATIQTRFFGQS